MVKVGDKVRLTSDGGFEFKEAKEAVGKIFTVEEVTRNGGVRVKHPWVYGDKNEELWLYCENEFKELEAYRPAVGDTIKILSRRKKLNDASVHDSISSGDVVRVTRLRFGGDEIGCVNDIEGTNFTKGDFDYTQDFELIKRSDKRSLLDGKTLVIDSATFKADRDGDVDIDIKGSSVILVGSEVWELRDFLNEIIELREGIE